jgi:septal ring factor EnvC (AmiA/AmiB activator)
MGEHILGISGLTPGGLGIWVLVFGLAARWIRGMPDRRRAGNEGVTAESKASQAQYERLEKEIARLTARVAAQGERIDRLEHDLIECERKHAEAESEIARLKSAA